MKTRYRLVEKWFSDEERWYTWGIVYENQGHVFPDRTLLFRTIPDDDRWTARHFDARIRALSPTLGEAERLIDPDWPIRFRVLPEIYIATGSSHGEIRERLWEQLFESMTAQAKDRQVLQKKYPLTQPAHHALRESDEADDA